MNKLFDAHNHFLNSADIAKKLSECHQKGVELLTVNSITENDWINVSLLSEQYSSVVPQFGIHPWFVYLAISGWEERLEQFLLRFPSAGVGECGLDKSDKHKKNIDTQIVIFKKHLQIAEKLNRPVSIHCVKAWMELFEALGNYKGKIKGVIHSFSGSVEIMEQLVNAGFYISFSPFILKNCSKKTLEAIKKTPIDNILIETDSPDTRIINKAFSTPAGLPLVLQKVAEIRNEDIDVIAASTYGNTKRLFGIN